MGLPRASLSGAWRSRDVARVGKNSIGTFREYLGWSQEGKLRSMRSASNVPNAHRASDRTSRLFWRDEADALTH
jgi:hypothetical protein